MNKKNIGIIGVGYWGKNILRNLHNLDAVFMACDIDEKLLEQYKQSFSGIRYTNNINDVLNCSEVKGVVIASPAITHYEIAKKVLSAGKDVLVEKPLALTSAQGKELVQIAKEKHRILMVGHVLQYHSAILHLTSMIAQGELGKIEYIYSNRLNIGKLRVEENILWSFAPHDISVILMLLGQTPKKVNCFGGTYLSKGIYDVTLMSLDFRNDVKAHVFVSWLHPFKEQKLVVVGSKAMVVFDDMTEEKLFLYPHKIEWQNGQIPLAHKAECYPVPIEHKEPLREELKHFMECIEIRAVPKTDGAEGLRVLEVLEEAERSLHKRDGVMAQSFDDVFVHETACIDTEVSIGTGTKIWNFSHILSSTNIGCNCVIGQNVAIGPNVTVGNGCKIQNNVSVYNGVYLEDDVFCGPSCVFTNVSTPRAFINRRNDFLKTHVRKGASIGANATIVCGVTIGRYAFIAAGAVVTRNVPDYGLVQGVPARLVGFVCRCGTRIDLENIPATCIQCGKMYGVNKEGNVEYLSDEFEVKGTTVNKFVK